MFTEAWPLVAKVLKEVAIELNALEEVAVELNALEDREVQAEDPTLPWTDKKSDVALDGQKIRRRLEQIRPPQPSK